MYTCKYNLIIKLIALCILVVIVGLLLFLPDRTNNMLTPRDSSVEPTLEEINYLRSEINLPKSELNALTFNQLQQLADKVEPETYSVYVFRAKKPKYKIINKLEPELTYDGVLSSQDPRLSIFGIDDIKIGLYHVILMGYDYVLEIER